VPDEPSKNFSVLKPVSSMHQRGKKGESAAFACPLSKFSQRMKHIKQMITSKDILFFEGLQSKVNPFLFVAYDNFRY